MDRHYGPRPVTRPGECPRCEREGMIHCEQCNGSGRAIGDIADCPACGGAGNLGPVSTANCEDRPGVN
jgi:hypothetical protein